MKNLLIVFMVALIMSGCVTARERFDQKCQVWKGEHIDSLVDSEWGYPDHKKTAPNGNDLYVYQWQDTKAKTHSTYEYVKSNPKNQKFVEKTHVIPVVESCTTFFEVNNDGVIINVRWKGRACKDSHF